MAFISIWQIIVLSLLLMVIVVVVFLPKRVKLSDTSIPTENILYDIEETNRRLNLAIYGSESVTTHGSINGEHNNANHLGVRDASISSTSTSIDELRANWIETTKALFDASYSVTELLVDNGVRDVDYTDLLGCVEWKIKRLEILVRDKHKCQSDRCGLRSYSNHVHHKYYIKDRLPWDIEDEALITLCNECHTRIHKAEDIKVFTIIDNQKVVINTNPNYCVRCNNRGTIPEYKHVQNGICFQCHGNSGYVRRDIFKNALENIFIVTPIRMYYRRYLREISTEDFKEKIYLG